jgi:WD40 repeat protein
LIPPIRHSVRNLSSNHGPYNFVFSKAIDDEPIVIYADKRSVKLDGLYGSSGVKAVVLRGHLNSITGLDCHPFDPTVYTCGSDHEIIRWKATDLYPNDDDEADDSWD